MEIPMNECSSKSTSSFNPRHECTKNLLTTLLLLFLSSVLFFARNDIRYVCPQNRSEIENFGWQKRHGRQKYFSS